MFAYQVRDPERYGVVSFDDSGRAVEVVEKPAAPISNWAVTGLYFYDAAGQRPRPHHPAFARAASWRSPTSTASIWKPARCRWSKLSRGCAWLDAGTPDSLLQAATFVQTIQSRTGMLVGCPEEVAFRMGFIDADDAARARRRLGKTELGRVLLELAEGELA